MKSIKRVAFAKQMAEEVVPPTAQGTIGEY